MYRFGERLAATTNLRIVAERRRHTIAGGAGSVAVAFLGWSAGGRGDFLDGRTSETAGFEEIAAGYRRLGVPLHVFPVGNPVIGDVAIENVIARVMQRRARLSRCAWWSAAVATQASGRKCAFGTVGAGAAAAGDLADHAQRRPETHELRVTKGSGPSQLVVEVTAMPGEAIEENNRVGFQIGARRQKVRVIYMEGTPTTVSLVRDALVKDPNIECVAMEVNAQYADRQILFRINDRNRGYRRRARSCHV